MINDLIKNFEDKEKELILKAFEFAKNAHQGQKRASGEDYINHPLEVAKILNEFNLDSKTIAAALLHDVIEDTNITKEQLENKFGKEISFLVDGVTKLNNLENKTNQIIDFEIFKKMIFAMTEDLRVVLLKLADRLHNLKTLKYLDQESQKRIAIESIEVYSPIAERLGMGELKGQIEDLAFPFAYPEEYKDLVERVKDDYQERLELLEKIKPILANYLKENGINIIDIHSRAKHYLSLYRKLKRPEINNDINKVHDLAAIRIILNNVSDCYKALGLIHTIYKPIPNSFSDYIALPKPNGYQSLHTKVLVPKITGLKKFFLGPRIIEIQLRTLEMHQHAEYGIASHWIYDEKKKRKKINIDPKEIAWVNRLRKWRENIEENPETFFESIKKEFFSGQIYVFTPKGNIKELPVGSTPVDFAYQIHTEIGHRTKGAKVDGKLVPLGYELKNGQIVEIITSKIPKPSLDWLNFVKTKEAQKRIKGWFKKIDEEKNIELGEKLLNKELKILRNTVFDNLRNEKIREILEKFSCKEERELFLKIGSGELTPKQVIKTGFKEEEILKEQKPKKEYIEKAIKSGIKVGGQRDILIKLAKCCSPVVPDKILGYVTKNSGISVHSVSCKNIQFLAREKLISASWEGEAKKQKNYLIMLEITAKDRIGLLKDIGIVFSDLGINISELKINQIKNLSKIIVGFEASNIEQFQKVIDKLRGIENIIKIRRT